MYCTVAVHLFSPFMFHVLVLLFPCLYATIWAVFILVAKVMLVEGGAGMVGSADKYHSAFALQTLQEQHVVSLMHSSTVLYQATYVHALKEWLVRRIEYTDCDRQDSSHLDVRERLTSFIRHTNTHLHASWSLTGKMLHVDIDWVVYIRIEYPKTISKYNATCLIATQDVYSFRMHAVYHNTTKAQLS